MDSWVSSLITAAEKVCPLVNEMVSARMEDLLPGQLSQGHLRPAELKRIATGLIEDMIPMRSEPEEMQ